MKAIMRDEREMKDSGIEWIGKIPKAWGLRKAKYVADFNPKVTIKFDENLPIGYVPMDAVKLGYMEPLEHDYNSLSTGLTQFQEDDIIMAKVTPCFENGEIAIAKNLAQGVGFGSSELFVYRTTEINQKYFFYYLQQLGFVDKATSTMTGTGGLKRISSYFANNAEVTLPSTEEQRAIANYLDDRCSKIDAIIAEAKASIEEYKELKQAVIYEAVTKGLDKNANLVNCKVNSLNKMPETWRIVPVKYLCSMQAGKNLISEQIADTGIYPVYGGNGLRGYYESYNTEGHRLLIGRQGALCGNIHEVNGKYWCTEHALVTTVKPIVDTHYLYYLFSAMNLNQYASNAAAQPGLAASNILNLRTIIPSLDMQKNISRCLDEKVSQLDSLINEKQALIEDMEAYKKSLIYEVVTGKRKVVA